MRESVLPADRRNPNILLDIARTGNRSLASLGVCGTGLAMCGVGYDLDGLASEWIKKGKHKQFEPNESHHVNTNCDLVNDEKVLMHNNIDTTNSTDDKLDINTSQCPKKPRLSPPPFPNRWTAAHLSPCPVPRDDWIGFRNELSALDPQLLFFPERCFEFQTTNAGVGGPIIVVVVCCLILIIIK